VPVLCIVILGSYIYFTESEMRQQFIKFIVYLPEKNAEKSTIATGSILIGS